MHLVSRESLQQTPNNPRCDLWIFKGPQNFESQPRRLSQAIGFWVPFCPVSLSLDRHTGILNVVVENIEVRISIPGFHRLTEF
jgi:hypothetical protein